jgi:hypothetical protein
MDNYLVCAIINLILCVRFPKVLLFTDLVKLKMKLDHEYFSGMMVFLLHQADNLATCRLFTTNIIFEHYIQGTKRPASLNCFNKQRFMLGSEFL